MGQRLQNVGIEDLAREANRLSKFYKMEENLLKKWNDAKSLGVKQLFVLIDPDQCNVSKLPKHLEYWQECGVTGLLVGGSIILSNQLDEVCNAIKMHTEIPTILFPGHPMHLSSHADAILILSLISGRNSELLIGHHVHAAPRIKAMNLEPVSTGYVLVSTGTGGSSVEYMSGTTPIPAGKTDIAIATSIAGEMLGLKTIYLEAGSGAHTPIPENLIRGVAKEIKVPLIVGGGINSAISARKIADAGADILVVGNAAEKDISVIGEIATAIGLKPPTK